MVDREPVATTELNVPHSMPNDGFDHIEALDCPCDPHLYVAVMIGVFVSHRDMGYDIRREQKSK